MEQLVEQLVEQEVEHDVEHPIERTSLVTSSELRRRLQLVVQLVVHFMVHFTVQPVVEQPTDFAIGVASLLDAMSLSLATAAESLSSIWILPCVELVAETVATITTSELSVLSRTASFPSPLSRRITLPIKICLPTGITTLPLAASIVVGPTVKPLCTTKLLFAMVPIFPYVMKFTIVFIAQPKK